MADLVLRGGTVVDGTGAPPYTADVAVTGGTITGVGRAGRGTREIDVSGLLVTPGFVDVHTHYDAQATWDRMLASSCWHGVTTTVMGNCGVGFAPARAADRVRLVELMEDVEDIPAAVLDAALPWTWESFAEYLDALETTPRTVDVAAQVPHSALRLHVMGERGMRGREIPTDDEREQMARSVHEALAAGAVGVSTARTQAHKTRDGELLPTCSASVEELLALAEGMRRAGVGVFEAASDRTGTAEEMERFQAFAARSGRPITLPVVQSFAEPDEWARVIASIERLRDEGVPVCAQVAVRPVGQLFAFDSTAHPFVRAPGFVALAGLDHDERIRRLADADVRAAIVAEADGAEVRDRLRRTFLVGDPVDYEPAPEASVAAEAQRRGVDALALAYDLMLGDGGRARLYQPSQNFAGGNADAIAAMLASPATVPGLSDGGAHSTQVCDVSFPTSLLTHWGRDRARGSLFPVEYLVNKHAAVPAALYGFTDRGVVAPGMKADLNVIDWDALRVHAPEMRSDLPAGGSRLVQRASGYRWTLCSGRVTFEDGEHTGEHPGTVVRSVQQ